MSSLTLIPLEINLTPGMVFWFHGKALSVVQMQNWQRSMMWTDTGLPWILPSPNLPTPKSAQFYVSTVFIEATTVSEGKHSK